MTTEPFGYLVKPFEPRELRSTIEMALYKHKLEGQLRTAAREWRTTFDAIGDGICLLDSECRIMRCNRAMATLLGKPFSEIVGRSCWEIMHGTDTLPNGCAIERMQKSLRRETQILPMGEQWFHVTVDPLLSDDGSLTGAVHIMSDITELKRTEDELKAAYQELEAAQQELIQSETLAALGEFAVGVAHEIRNPLTNISASAQYCLSKQHSQEQIKKYLNMILRNSERANRIIKDLLDFAKPRQLSLTSGDVVQIIEKACSLTETQRSGQEVHLEKKYPETLPKVMMDEKQIAQVFINLILNALDAMGKGGTLSIRAYPEGEELVITFVDTPIRQATAQKACE